MSMNLQKSSPLKKQQDYWQKSTIWWYANNQRLVIICRTFNQDKRLNISKNSELLTCSILTCSISHPPPLSTVLQQSYKLNRAQLHLKVTSEDRVSLELLQSPPTKNIIIIVPVLWFLRRPHSQGLSLFDLIQTLPTAVFSPRAFVSSNCLTSWLPDPVDYSWAKSLLIKKLKMKAGE